MCGVLLWSRYAFGVASLVHLRWSMGRLDDLLLRRVVVKTWGCSKKSLVAEFGECVGVLCALGSVGN